MQVEKWEDKVKIMKAKSILREQKVYIENDITVDERRIQAIILSRARVEKDKGNIVKTGNKNICINGK